MNEFRFSPRPNRAGDIGWLPWGADAFERARTDDKPILLSISAVWCHWCHVMDETSYSDPDVIATINERFVPIRVDNDRRPDVNARYNMGGWPTTAFLTPDGSTITGATYLPPENMRRALDDIAQFYAENKAEIASRVTQLQSRHTEGPPAAQTAPAQSTLSDLVEVFSGAYDAEYGGFGTAPKFPQPELLEFLLGEWRVTGNQHLYAMVETTVLAMARGGTYDHVEGGFFRYSTTRDWSVPHFEKMAEDHAGLLRVLAQLVLFAPASETREILVSAVRYVRTTLRDVDTGLFAGSQDADEAYFALPLEERRAREAPFVDRTSYTNWTCSLAGAWFYAARALDDDVMVREAMQTLDTVHERLTDPDGLAYHYVVPGGAPQMRGLLTDQTAYLRALLDAHEVSGETRYLERAEALAGRIIARFEAGDGGFYDRIALGESLGRLTLADRPIVDNAQMADSLLRLGALTGKPTYRAHAERALALYVGTFSGAGTFAAVYGRALRRLLSPETSVRIVGATAATDGFRETALRLPAPGLVIRTVPAKDAERLTLPPDPQPAAYVCSGTVCGAPVTDPALLREAFDSLTAVPKP